MGIILILALLLSYCSDTKSVTLRRYHDVFIRGRNKVPRNCKKSRSKTYVYKLITTLLYSLLSYITPVF